MPIRYRALLALTITTAACGGDAGGEHPLPPDSIAAMLTAMAAQDQRDRVDLTVERMRDTAFARRLIAADSVRTAGLESLMARHDWPGVGALGAEGAAAFFLIVQHSASNALKAAGLAELEPLARVGLIDPGDYALLFDRVRVGRGEPQRFGSQFDLVNGRLVPSPIESLERVDSLRAEFGLPPMATYVRVLAEAYDAEVVWPPPDTLVREPR